MESQVEVNFDLRNKIYVEIKLYGMFFYKVYLRLYFYANHYENEINTNTVVNECENSLGR